MNPAAADTSQRPGRARPMSPEDRRASIIDVAIPLILEHGADVTTRQIAEGAGIAEGTVFRAFADKSELIDAAIERVMDSTALLAALSDVEASAPLEAKIGTVVTLLHAHVSGVVRFMSVLGPRDHARLQKRGHAHRRPPLGEASAAIRALLERDVARLRVPLDAAVEYVRILVFGTAMPFVAGEAAADPSQLADFILHGIAKEGN